MIPQKQQIELLHVAKEICLELTADSVMNKSLMVGSLMTDVSTVGPLGEETR